MPIPLIDLKRQYLSIKTEIDQAISETISHASFIMGEPIKKFEDAFALCCNVSYGVATSSGTSALYLALVALGVGPGDEVITVPNTFIATAEAITMTGGRVVFVDIDRRTFNIDPAQIEPAITKKTKAIIPVHLFGQAASMDAIMALAKKHHLKIIEDASQAHLGAFENKRVGSFGDAACFSFYPAKNLGAYGDAGMVVTHDKALAQKMRMLSDHGRTNKHEHQFPGFNFRMDGLQAAILNVKLKYLGDWTKRRRQIAEIYNDQLENLVEIPYVDKKVTHVYHQYVIRVQAREHIQAALAHSGIATGIHYPVPLHLQKAYEGLGYAKGDFPVTEEAALEILSIPIFPELTEEEMNKIIVSLKSILPSASLERIIA